MQQCIKLSRTNDRALLLRGAENSAVFISSTCILFTVQSKSLGDWSGGGTPGHIPNPEVKAASADGTWVGDPLGE